MAFFDGIIKFPKLSVGNVWQLDNFTAMLCAKYERFHETVVADFGPNGMLIVLLFVFFLALILTIYIKSLIDTFQNNDEDDNDDGLLYASEDITAELEEKRQNAAEQKEKELSLELLQASFRTVPDSENAEEYEYTQNLKETLKAQTLTAGPNIFDWKAVDWQSGKFDVFNLLQNKDISGMPVCLIINLLGRGVSELKTAQSVFNYTHGILSEEDIIQAVAGVKNFVGLCNSKKFDDIPQRETFPTNDKALTDWANGDTDGCLDLMEALLNFKLTSLEEDNDDETQEFAQALIANYACLMGNMAFENKKELAQNTFDLALELSPNNINALSRRADLYMADNQLEEAAEYYQKVLQIADKTLYESQIANANNKLSAFYQMRGNGTLADKLRDEGKYYYKNSGINAELTDREIIALNIIADGQFANLQASVAKLFYISETE
jgi:tetratricopeptide (TPR) repeat protein